MKYYVIIFAIVAAVGFGVYDSTFSSERAPLNLEDVQLSEEPDNPEVKNVRKITSTKLSVSDDVEGFLHFAFPELPSTQMELSFQRSDSKVQTLKVISDDKGRVSTAITREDIGVTISLPSYVPITRDFSPIDTQGETRDLGDLHASMPGKMAGRIVFDDQSPASAVHIFLSALSAGSRDEHYQMTGLHGIYEFTDLPDGRYLFEIRHQFFAPQQADVFVRKGVPTISGDITIHSGGTIGGTATGFENWPGIQKNKNAEFVAEITLKKSDEYFLPLSRKVDADRYTGAFEIDRLPPGQYKVHLLWGRTSVSDVVNVTVSDREYASIELNIISRKSGRTIKSLNDNYR